MNELLQQHELLVKEGLVELDYEDWLASIFDHITNEYNWL